MSVQAEKGRQDWWGDGILLAYRNDLPEDQGRVVKKTGNGFTVEGIDHSYDGISEAIDVAFEFIEAV